VQRRQEVPFGELVVGEGDPASCSVSVEQHLFVCPAGSTPDGHADSLEIAVTLRDGTGAPLIGMPADQVSVYVSGISKYEDGAIHFCSGPTSVVYDATDPTDDNGVTAVRDSTVGGCGHIYVDSVRVGSRIFAARDTLEVRSPDFTGDGVVNFLDTGRYAQELQAGCGLCGDLRYDGQACSPPLGGSCVNFLDTFKYAPHMNGMHTCPAPGKSGDEGWIAGERDRRRGKPRIETAFVTGGQMGKATTGSQVEATVVVEDLSPVSGVHFDIGFDPALAELVSLAVEDLYPDYRVWGPFVREDRNVVDVTVTTKTNGEVVAGDVVIAKLRFDVNGDGPTPIWLEGFHTADAAWEVDTLYEGESVGGEPALGLGFVAIVPNPFNPTTEIRFATGKPGRVSVLVYDVSGRRVRTVIEGKEMQAGVHSVLWDGRSESGRETGSGIYFCMIVGVEGSSVRRMVLLR
jgi:hypothetical protein